MKKVVVFGAGLVAKPGIQYLLDQGYQVTVATRTVSKAKAIVGDAPNGKAMAFDISKESLEETGLIQDCDLAISLLPYKFHPEIAKACIKYKKHMATTSYVSDEMQALDEEAKKAGIILLNECGVDPGTDHMSAMRVIHHVEENGGKIVSFRSYCGGLPAPEDNDNPMGYKFSWSPKGVLLAGRNPAKYLEYGELVEIRSGELFRHFWPMKVKDMIFEAYPNRNSMPYKELYGIKAAETMFRGTLRYPGWCETIQGMFDLGLLDMDERDDLEGLSWKQLLAKLLTEKLGKILEEDLSDKMDAFTKDIKEKVVLYLRIAEDSEIINRMNWLGFFKDKKIPKENNVLDVISDQFMEKLGTFKPEERDMLIMLHEFIAEYPDRKEKITSTMLEFGVPNGDSAMARTVSLPVAIAVKMILEGEITGKGIVIPIEPEVYNPILDELEEMDIVFEEKTITL
ncbi:MAG: saccharopine dehydrogenase [Candidatus Heimdallarchaeota archaeon]|nr:saccharopine dehydrogenase [Candidatus Heimdallarchaeota archaeon]